ncbi:phosphatidylserine/phosphatidylglycerophosphate/cardiolipin synthase family protein [Sphingomonas sp. MMS24-J13]|uniref:phospholipase D-like domain-containing protein n=1 Tax=Sphingomonas sp. MMS24-J13 TaxID=3238686 RepID=UPI00384A8702
MVAHISFSPKLATGLALLCLSACASVPKIDPAIGHAAVAQKPRINDRDGALSTAEIRRVVDQLTLSPGDDALLRHHLAIEQAVAGGPLIEGETTDLLKDGPSTFRAIFAAIAGAKHRIDLEYYIFQDVESDGRHIGDLLLEKRAQGVTVNIIYDDFGSGVTPGAFFDRLRDAGVNVVKFNPLNPLKSKIGYKPNDRDHRKILVVDGTIGIVGGVNLATEYQTVGVARSGPIEHEADRPWRDTDVRVAGPAVSQLEAIFVEHWRAQKGPALPDVVQLPNVPGAKGNSVVRFIGSTPDHAVPRYYATLVSALRSAEKSITADAAYFVPTKDEMHALTDAARRGVHVTLILPDKSNSTFSLAVGHAHYGALLRSGVKIYETRGVVLHSKTVTVDGVWSVIGSSNFDHRSIVFNDEVDAIVIGSRTADELEAMAAEDRQSATEISLDHWKHRSISERAKEAIGSIWQNLL